MEVMEVMPQCLVVSKPYPVTELKFRVVADTHQLFIVKQLCLNLEIFS